MDRKKLETKLIEWSSDFGFTLPNGLPPPANYFSLLTATPRRFQLWEAILNVIEPRTKVEFIRKQIFLSKLKSSKGKINSKDFFLQAVQEARHDKLELWKKKEMLERDVKEKRMEIEELELEIQNQASLIQSEICKMAEAKKQCSECKEKTMVLKLSLKIYEERLQNYLNFLSKIKECRNVYELDGPGNKGDDLKDLVLKINQEIKCSCEKNEDCDLLQYINEICQNKIPENTAWETVLSHKRKTLEDFNKSASDTLTQEDERLNEEKSRLAPLKSTVEKIMLDITEKSLQTILDEHEEKSLDLKIKEMYKKLLIDEDSQSDDTISFLGPDESYDVEKNEIARLKDGLNYIGMKRRLEFLKSELERINEDCERKKIFLEEKEEADRKLSESRNKLDNLYEELESVTSQQELSEEKIKEEYSNLKSAVEETEIKMSDPSYVENVKKNVKGLENSVQEYARIFSETNLDAFRRIQGPSGREILECESLPDCLNNYGGELKDLFSALSISPYQPVESIMLTVKERKKFSDSISKLISRSENFIREQGLALNTVSSDFDYSPVDKNNKETDKILTKALNRLGHLPGAMESIEKILNAWSEQPFRHMIPETKKLNELTYRQYESQYQKSLDVLKYYSNARKT